jgi:metallophosphoesterase superfamily enzyme
MSEAAFLKQPQQEVCGLGASRILFCGKSFIADHTGMLYWPAEEALIMSDLCLGKGSYLAEDDAVLPPYDTVSVFEKLEDALNRYDPARVIALGNSFGPVGNYNRRLSIHDIDWLVDLMDGREWYWVSGEDEPDVPDRVAGTVCPYLSLSNIRFRHKPVQAPVTHEIAGCAQPVAIFNQYGRTSRARCFVSNGMRLVMPSTGHYGAGNNVLGNVFNSLMGNDGLFVWVISHGQTIPVAAGQLLEDAEQAETLM